MYKHSISVLSFSNVSTVVLPTFSFVCVCLSSGGFVIGLSKATSIIGFSVLNYML